MENSITATKITGRVILFSTSAMMTKIAMIEIAFTTLKSSSVVSIRSFVQGASPISIPVESYFFRISFSASIWALTSSDATLYSELARINFQLSLFSMSFTDFGSISSGTRAPTTDSMPSTYFMPSTCSISEIMLLTSFAETSVLTRIICVEPTSNSSFSLELAIT